MIRFKAVVYDLDGTLVDSFRDIAEAANCGMIACGRNPLSLDEWKTLVGYGIDNLFRWAMAGGRDENGVLRGPEPSDEEIRLAVKATKAHYDIHPVTHSTTYPSVPEILRTFAGLGIKQAILSNKMDGLVTLISERLGLNQWIDAAIGDSPRFPQKPDPLPLYHLMEVLGVSPEETLMVGDAETDAETARNAGVKVCLLTYGSRSRKELEVLKPDWLIDNFASLKSIVITEDAM